MLTRRNLLATAAISIGASATAGLALAAEEKVPTPKNTKNMPMRRMDEALTREECLEVVEKTNTAVLATADGDGVPYAVPVTPFMYGGKIYFHGVGTGIGRRAANLHQNPEVSLCYVAKSDRNEPNLTTDFVSVIIAGKCRLVENHDKKREIMRQLIAWHAPTMDSVKEIGKRELKLHVVSVYEIEIESMTGKAKPAGFKRFFGSEMPKRGAK